MKFPFPIQPEYTQIALAYQNRTLIADQVLPRVGVGSREFRYYQQTKDESFTIPNTMVGRKGQPNEVEFTMSEVPGFVKDYGLDDVIPIEDIDSAPAGYDPLGRAVEGITDLILLDREKRVADLVFNTATYPTGNKATLALADQWHNFASASSDPVEDILAAIDGMWVKPNTLVLGSQVWYQLRRHPKIIAAVIPTGSNAATGGIASQQAVADLFEVSNLLIGGAFVNTAKKGQAASYSRVWGKSAALLHLNPLANLRGNGITFGATAQYGGRVAGSMDEPKVGLRGAKRVRAGESVNELIVASDAGYLFDQAVV